MINRALLSLRHRQYVQAIKALQRAEKAWQAATPANATSRLNTLKKAQKYEARKRQAWIDAGGEED